jgi:hypothetical protein
VFYSNDGIVSFGTASPTQIQEEMPLLDDDYEHDHESDNIKLLDNIKGRLLMYTDIFNKGMWKTTFLLWILWIGCGWIYYGVVLLTTSIFHGSNHCFTELQNTSNESNCEELSNGSYIKIFWTSVAELPGLVVTIIMIEILGRKKTMALEFFGTMAGFLLLFVCSTS